MANSSCSHWWHAPFYIAMSLTLAFISFAAMNNSRPANTPPSLHGPALNASRALRSHGGFNVLATLLQFSPDLFFPSGHESTLFAIQDSAISNLSVSPLEMRRLMQYHTARSALPKAGLIKKRTGFCFKTLLQDKNLIVTKADPKTGSIMINNVLVSHPDLFLDGPITVHGVVGPFDPARSVSCGGKDRSVSVSNSTDRPPAEWVGVIRFLSSNGFVSFAIGLNAVLDRRMVREDLGSGWATVFAPPNSGFISSPSPFLDRIVRVHIVNQRFTYTELLAVNGSLLLKTLVPDHSLKIENFDGMVAVNGVEIVAPDMFLSKNFVVHGISRAFDLEDSFSSF